MQCDNKNGKFKQTCFFNFLIPDINKHTIEEHIYHVSSEGTWATQVEVVATATVF